MAKIVDIENKELKVGDKVAYATIKDYKPVVHKSKINKIDEFYVYMGKFSCQLQYVKTRVLKLK